MAFEYFEVDIIRKKLGGDNDSPNVPNDNNEWYIRIKDAALHSMYDVFMLTHIQHDLSITGDGSNLRYFNDDNECYADYYILQSPQYVIAKMCNEFMRSYGMTMADAMSKVRSMCKNEKEIFDDRLA